MEANNVAATRATDFAFFNLTMAACISVIAFLLFRSVLVYLNDEKLFKLYNITYSHL